MEYSAWIAYTLGFFALLKVSGVDGHGMMLDPASRGSAWRFGWGTPIQHTDNELNCGGAPTQKAHNGKCGVCGDEWNAANTGQYVFGGKWATGTIVANYKQGQIIESEIRVTANHKGTYEWWLGDIGTPPITIEKLKYLLKIIEVDGKPYDGTHWTLPGSPSKVTNKFKLQLPSHVSCAHCVLQWWWKVGNSWGCDQDVPDRFGKPHTGPDRCCVGCGHQETFVNCADVTIEATDGSILTTAATPKPPKPPTTKTTTVDPNQQCQAIGDYLGDPEMDHWCNVNCPDNCPTTDCKCTYHTTTTEPVTQPPETGAPETEAPETEAPETKAPTVKTQPPTTKRPKTDPPITSKPDNGECVAAGAWTGDAGMTTWCVDNCKLNNCPMSHCSAGCLSLLPPAEASTTECHPKDNYYHSQHWQNWCVNQCSTGPCNQHICSPGCLLLAPEPPTCHAVSHWKGQASMDAWCQSHCPAYCPASHCSNGCRHQKKKDESIKKTHHRKDHHNSKAKKRNAKKHHHFKFHPRKKSV